MEFESEGTNLQAEEDFLLHVKKMLMNKDFHFPYAKAIADCRKNLEGMTAATMQEQILIDALDDYFTNHLGLSKDTLKESPKRSAGSDFKYEDCEFEHKVGRSGATEIAALWDISERALQETWTFENPIIFSSGGYGTERKKISSTSGGDAFKVIAFGPDPDVFLGAGNDVLLVQWGEGREVEVKKHYENSEKISIVEFCKLRDVYRDVVTLTAEIPSNHLEFFEVSTKTKIDFHSGFKFCLETEERAGVYVFPQENLVDLPLLNALTTDKPNNKAQLVSRDKVRELMMRSEDRGLFVPLPIWWGAVSGNDKVSIFQSSKRLINEFRNVKGSAR